MISPPVFFIRTDETALYKEESFIRILIFLCAPGMGAVYRVRVPNHEGSSNG